nr:hypothetical protein [Vibrio vulnificus]
MKMIFGRLVYAAFTP